MMTNSFPAMATNVFCGAILLTGKAYLFPNREFLLRVLAHAHCTSITRRILFPCMILRDLILPTDSLFRGLSPARPTGLEDVLNEERSLPDSDSTVIAF
jgi:hypothetical protein